MGPTTRPYNSVRLPRPASKIFSARITHRRPGRGTCSSSGAGAARSTDRARGRRPRAVGAPRGRTSPASGRALCWTRSSRRCARGASRRSSRRSHNTTRRDRKWDAAIGVADVDGGARFAHRPEYAGQWWFTRRHRPAPPTGSITDSGGVLEGPRGLGVHHGLRRGEYGARCAAAAGPRARPCPLAKRRRRRRPRGPRSS